MYAEQSEVRWCGVVGMVDFGTESRRVARGGGGCDLFWKCLFWKCLFWIEEDGLRRTVRGRWCDGERKTVRGRW